MTVRKIRNSWWVDFRHEYVRYRKKSPDNSRSGAQAYEAVLRQKLARGEALASPKQNKAQKEREQKFKDFAWKWLQIYVKNNNKLSERNNKTYTLRTHLVPFFGETAIEELSTLNVEQYKAKKIDEGLSAKTINNHLTVLSSCLNTARNWFELKRIPKIKKLKTPPPETVFLSQLECDKLSANSSGIWQDVIFTVLNTGLRRGELKALKWSDINWENKTLTVRHSWCEYKKGLTTPKSNRERHIPLTNELYERLLRLKKPTGFVFWDEKIRMFSNKMLNREIRNTCMKAGIRKITCHGLRHTFASHLAMAGASLKAIQELLGHSKIETTMRYAHLTPSTLRQTVDLLDQSKGIPRYLGQHTGNDYKHPNSISYQLKPDYSENPYLKT